tara:strand:- start:669 stop:1247 length:579 start_codon:yes stop_codon:yes gene_type:complete
MVYFLNGVESPHLVLYTDGVYDFDVKAVNITGFPLFGDSLVTDIGNGVFRIHVPTNVDTDDIVSLTSGEYGTFVSIRTGTTQKLDVIVRVIQPARFIREHISIWAPFPKKGITNRLLLSEYIENWRNTSTLTIVSVEANDLNIGIDGQYLTIYRTSSCTDLTEVDTHVVLGIHEYGAPEDSEMRIQIVFTSE